ncbi:mitotic checkpoint serine/threonine-protein kinase BUB1 [Eurytemora carolleeae]|uniref:mitotic checkpoint serine/threonine-protein kinase BUB1 n=1 Tax=Eurytemora carolleeae TaxID=1294199 RepID=UPI000C783DA3|nr:mitotic checkpoint serine/threonine-protein kinase BUB1 [Eurytemora carolleeae]|eukprot:XP_023323367.1 mitotic checkpoint serine/threonine-protein kinase BUB1-like [Eurytemora affinis]
MENDVPCIRDGADSAEQLFDFSSTSVQLIDFGRAIDLNILPKGIVFTEEVKTDGIRCIEMREGREWREHIDYYGIAATAYCLLFGTYMEVVKTKDVWEVKGSYKRFFKATELWKQFFHEFLNIKDTSKESLPVLREWRIKFMEIFYRENMKEALDQVKAIFQARS